MPLDISRVRFTHLSSSEKLALGVLIVLLIGLNDALGRWGLPAAFGGATWCVVVRGLRQLWGHTAFWVCSLSLVPAQALLVIGTEPLVYQYGIWFNFPFWILDGAALVIVIVRITRCAAA
jgi:hypothetical protein